MTVASPAPAVEQRLTCAICGAKVHSIQHHLSEDHKSVTLAQYQEKYPGQPIMSELMKIKLEERERAKLAGAAVSTEPVAHVAMVKRAMHEVFGLGAVPAALGASGKPIMITTFDPDKMDQIDRDMIPPIDPNYVFNLDVLRTVLVGVERNIPTYVWGHAGVGKTTFLEQVFARTGRPCIRVQHTANMEESHVVGQWLLRDGRTIFEPGPLTLAMRRGWAYLADEYDFGRAEVLSVYQPVLEGKQLIIKEADAENRRNIPHSMFRFVGTGNTNGTGDETGLYAGTNVQNAANYERYGITEKMPYMEAEMEARVVSGQGAIPIADARKLVDYANRIRTEFEGGKLSNPISPRTLIYAATVGKARGSFMIGLQKSFINRLSSVDRESATQLAQRVFGA